MNCDFEKNVPEVDPDAWVAPNASIIGKVKLEKNSSIWFNAVLRGDIEFICLLYTSPSPRDKRQSRMPSSA